MPKTRYQWHEPSDQIASVEIASNSFGRKDAVIAAADGADAGALKQLTAALNKRGIVAYPDLQDGKPVLTAYGFGKDEDLVAALKTAGAVKSKPSFSQEAIEGEKSDAQKYVQRYSVQMAAASGLLGHASMYSLAALTGNKSFYLTAAGYTAADGVIAAYGTDKSVTADPVMQDFKRYLWQQGIDNGFVKADQGRVSFAKSTDNFLKNYGFEVANAAGASGNLGMIMGGLKGSQKDFGMVTAGATSLFGAGLQIFGTEAKIDPADAKRKSIGANALNFFNANPMQIAGVTNIADPLLLMHSALMTNQRNRRTITENTRQIHDAQAGMFKLAQEGHLNLGALPDTIRSAIETERGILKDVDAVRAQIETLEGPKFKGWGPIGAVVEAVRDLKGPKTDELKELYATLTKLEAKIASNSKFIGESAADLHKSLKGKHLQEAAKIAGNIKDWQQEINFAHRGGKVEPYIRGLVAVFYGGATMLRLISRKTASADENRDAFNEVYAAAAESLLNIEQPQQREDMLLQFGHYLSTHPKMKEPSDIILTKLRERVQAFEDHPFVAVQKRLQKPANDAGEPSAKPDVSIDASHSVANGPLADEHKAVMQAGV